MTTSSVYTSTYKMYSGTVDDLSSELAERQADISETEVMEWGGVLAYIGWVEHVKVFVKFLVEQGRMTRSLLISMLAKCIGGMTHPSNTDEKQQMFDFLVKTPYNEMQ